MKDDVRRGSRPVALSGPAPDHLDEAVERRGSSIDDYTAPDGSTFTLAGRSLMLVRNVGHLMTNPAILLKDGREAARFVRPKDEAVLRAALARIDAATHD